MMKVLGHVELCFFDKYIVLCRTQQHVPFRESKLTHYLQSFFNGKGKVCMIVNISQAASAYDETLNVLKFSAIAQKVCTVHKQKHVNLYNKT